MKLRLAKSGSFWATVVLLAGWIISHWCFMPEKTARVVMKTRHYFIAGDTIGKEDVNVSLEVFTADVPEICSVDDLPLLVIGGIGSDGVITWKSMRRRSPPGVVDRVIRGLRDIMKEK